MIRGELSLREIGLFSLEKSMLQGDLRVVFQYLKGTTGELERGFLKGYGVTQQGAMASDWKELSFDIRKKFCHRRVVRH